MYLKLTKAEAAQLVKAGLEGENPLIVLPGKIKGIEIHITATGVGVELEFEEANDPDKE